jgi:hypothetical protein
MDEQLYDFLKVLRKRKIFFLILFILIILLGLIYDFIFKPSYESTSAIKINLDQFEEVKRIDPNFYMQINNLFDQQKINEDFYSPEILNKLNKSIKVAADNEYYKNLINIDKSEYPSIVTIKTLNNNPVEAYLLNKDLLIFYKELKKEEFYRILKNTTAHINSYRDNINSFLNKNSSLTNQNLIILTINPDYSEKIESLTSKLGTLDLLSKKIEQYYEQQDIFLNVIEVTLEPRISSLIENEGLKDNLLKIIILAFAISSIIVYLFEFILRNKKNNLK